MGHRESSSGDRPSGLADVVTCFVGTAISVFGVEGLNSRNKRANSSYTLDGLTPRVHLETATTATPNVLLYSSATLEDTQHTLVIQNLAKDAGKVFLFVRLKLRVLTLILSVELRLDYFEITGSAIEDDGPTPICE